MNITKLSLKDLAETRLIALATTHETAMTGNAAFTSPIPSADDFDSALDGAVEALAEVEALHTAWRTAVAKKNNAIEVLKRALRSRSSYVNMIAQGNEAIVLSAGFEVRAAQRPSQPIAAPTGLEATMSEAEGAIDLEWESLKAADCYVVQHSANVLPRVWEQVTICTRADHSATGLTSGERHVFRVAAVGPLGQGPWSDEATKRAP